MLSSTFLIVLFKLAPADLHLHVVRHQILSWWGRWHDPPTSEQCYVQSLRLPSTYLEFVPDTPFSFDTTPTVFNAYLQGKADFLADQA